MINITVMTLTQAWFVAKERQRLQRLCFFIFLISLCAHMKFCVEIFMIRVKKKVVVVVLQRQRLSKLVYFDFFDDDKFKYDRVT